MAETIVLPNSSPAGPVTGSPTFTDSDAFGELDRIAGIAPAEPPVPAGPAPAPETKPAERPRDDTGKFTKPPERQPEKTAATKPPEPKPTATPAEVDPGKMAPKALREAYESLKSKHSQLEKEHTEFKSRATQPADDPEKKTLSERLAEREKRIADYEERLRFTDYSQSDDYKEKFQVPFEDAYLAGRSRVAALKIVETKGEEGEVIQQGRQGTPEDFDELMKIADDDVAAEWAAQKFGAKSSMVLFHRERVQELNGARKKAIEEYRKNGSEREKQRSEQMAAFTKRFDEAIESAGKAAAEKYPQWFKPDDTDAKGNELLEFGNHIVARVVANGKQLKDGDKPMSTEDLARAISAIRSKAGAFDRVAHRLNVAQKQNKALEAELAEFRASVPGKGTEKIVRGAGSTEEADTPEKAFDMQFPGAR